MKHLLLHRQSALKDDSSQIVPQSVYSESTDRGTLTTVGMLDQHAFKESALTQNAFTVNDS